MSNSSPPRDRLPFEPRKKNRKPPKKAPVGSQSKASAPSSGKKPASSGIPEVVSQRMLVRMALFCVTPSLLGIASMIGSYFVVTEGWFELPHSAVVAFSLGCFGIGAIGLSYGALSASWDEREPGSLLGWREFLTNFGRARQGWQTWQTQQRLEREQLNTERSSRDGGQQK